MVGAAAAALVEMAARASGEDWEDAGGAVAQAAALRSRLEPLIQADAEVLEAALDRLRNTDGHDEALGEVLGQAALVPLQITEASACVAQLAAEAADKVRPDLRPDAATAALFAEAAARTGATLVEVNLATLEGDERLAEARRLAKASTQAAARALERT
jgi:formiminotetrahydrofolate cyclodeaminase